MQGFFTWLCSWARVLWTTVVPKNCDGRVHMSGFSSECLHSLKKYVTCVCKRIKVCGLHTIPWLLHGLHTPHASQVFIPHDSCKAIMQVGEGSWGMGECNWKRFCH